MKDDFPKVSVIIAAAGSSRRMNGTNKMLLTLNGKPVINRTAEIFDSMAEVSEIIISVPAGMSDFYSHLLSPVKKVKAIVAGGETRQESIKNAVAACSPDSEIFCIHDGARPLVTADVIRQAIEACTRYGSAAAGVKVKDTIKTVDEEGFITSTPDRSKLIAVQTPQCFKREIYLNALEELGEAARDVTDDCKMIEMTGGSVMITQGSYSNIKITTPQDIAIAEKLLDNVK